MSNKFCPRCDKEKSCSEFGRNKSRIDGLQDYCKPCQKEYMSSWAKAHRMNLNSKERRYRRHLKELVLTHYGSGTLACVICGEARLPCLSIDHIAGRGLRHRRSLGISSSRIISSREFYSWLKQQGYPKGFQTLCMNCQMIKKFEHKEYA